MTSSIPPMTQCSQTITLPLEKDIWDALRHNKVNHLEFIERSLKGNQQHEQDILEEILDEAYSRSIPQLIEAILFHSPIKPTANLFTIIFSKGPREDLRALWTHYPVKKLQERHQEALVDFLKMIPSFIDLQEIVNLMIECGADMRKIVLDDAKYTLIYGAEYLVIAQYWLTFLNPEDKKAEVLKKFSLSWQLLN